MGEDVHHTLVMSRTRDAAQHLWATRTEHGRIIDGSHPSTKVHCEVPGTPFIYGPCHYTKQCEILL